MFRSADIPDTPLPSNVGKLPQGISFFPFVCLLISVSFALAGHKSGTFTFRQLLESLLGIRLETAESDGEKGERGMRINELQRKSERQGEC